jgi:hypothetical protein
MHGPTCIFWANLTPFSHQYLRLYKLDGEIRHIVFADDFVMNALNVAMHCSGPPRGVYMFMRPQRFPS